MIRYAVRTTGPLLTDRQLLQRFDGEVQRTLAEIGAIGQRLVVADTPRGASGILHGSVVTELRGTPGQRAAVVTSSAFYAPIVEEGRRPGRRPPIEALRLWVVRKLGVSSAAAPRVAFLVARKIGRAGFPGAHMFQRAALRLVPIATQRFTALEERLARLLNGGR